MFKEEHEREERKRKDKEERKDSVSIAKEEIILILSSGNMIVHIENPRTNKEVQQNCSYRSIHTNQLHFYILTMNI